ncbi:MAG: peptidoglycan DD-metalloendopeptidase family protein [Chitinophagaceae bacterium]
MISESVNIFIRNQPSFYPVIKFDPLKEKLMKINLTASNPDLTTNVIQDTALFTAYIESTLKAKRCKWGIGGYNEHRTIYNRSRVFDALHALDEPRRLHLGIDIWGPAGTPVFAPLGGMIHSFAFNNNFGDYGATIILLHQLDGFAFYTLYGHMSLRDIQQLNEGGYVIRGQEIGHFGERHENGQWPPHLHFQVIFDIGMNEGDYPGVCRYSEREKYLENCPDPDYILQMNRFITS